jgi:hypothetical protein
VAACAALAWPGGSPVEAAPGGRLAGDRAWAWAFVVCAAAGLATYAGGVLLLAQRPVRASVVVALAVGIQVAPLAAPLLLSTDAWSYWDYGRIATVHDGNPYRDSPDEFPRDPAFRYVGEDWRDSTSVYGPAFTLASEPLARMAGSSADTAAWIYKVLGAAAVLAAALLAARVSRRPALAAAFVGWNPLLALHFGGGGHNDAWMAALVVGALAAGASGRRHVAGAAWAAAIFVKWVPLVFLPLRVVQARATGRPAGHLGFLLAVAVLAGLATWRYGRHWFEAFGLLARNANQETRFALPHRLEQLGSPRWLAVGLLAVLFLAAYAWLVREAVRGRARMGLASGLLLLAVPYLAPWYAVWAVPLAAADDDRDAQVLAVAICAYLLPQTVPL